jgi:hypothetical protein
MRRNANAHILFSSDNLDWFYTGKGRVSVPLRMRKVRIEPSMENVRIKLTGTSDPTGYWNIAMGHVV